MTDAVVSPCLCQTLCRGGGWAEQQGLSQHVDISLGTFSKAFGGHGGFVAGGADPKRFLMDRGRPFLFSTALPAPVVAAPHARRPQTHGAPEYRSGTVSGSNSV